MAEANTIVGMGQGAVVSYLERFLQRGEECAYRQRRGYRSLSWSYRRVVETAFQFARELESRGIVKGDRVLLWGPNSAEWVAVFWGCALRGAVVVPVDEASSADFAERLCRQVDAKLLVCSHQHALSGWPSIVLEDLPRELVGHSCAFYDSSGIAATDTLEVVFTSGTTAEPKGVVITHGNVVGNIAPLEAEIRRYLKYEPLAHPVRFLNLLPLSHVFGQFLGIFLPQLVGGTVIFQEELNPAEVMRTIRRERVSVLAAVPRMLQSLKDKVERDLGEKGSLADFQRRFRASEGKHFLRRWWSFRRIHRQFGWKFWAFICGGAALDRATEEFWGRLGFAVVQGYGLTETTSLVSVNHPFRPGRGSIGKVLAGREVKLAPDGEILIRGTGVASGYWSGRELQRLVAEGEWYGTGDIGALDAQGNLYFKGRKKDVIVTAAGMNVYPQDLETALRRQPEVKDCVVVPLPRGGNAESCAVLILRHPEADPGEVIQRANETLAEYQRMRNWLVWPEQDFPRTPTQKPRTREIQEMAQARVGGKPAEHAAVSTLATLIARVKGISAGELRHEANLETDLDLSSLDRVELLGALEERYQLELGETSFAAVKTVGDVENLLRGQLLPRTRYHYPAWVQHWPVTWIRFAVYYSLARPAIILLGWPRVEGQDNLRDVDGPVLVVCNHIAGADVGYVATALPARLRHRLATAAGGETLESLRTPPAGRSVVGKIYDRVEWTLGVSLLNLFPLPKAAGFRESFAYAGESVDRGYSVLVFPEGRHTTDGNLGVFRAGIGLLANSLGIPVVPMRIDGLFEVKQSGRRFALPWKIRVKIGAPVQFPRDSDPAWIARQLREQVEAL